MIQQTIALILIAFFVLRLFLQKRKKRINSGEFIFWLLFWLFSAAVILSLKTIDRVVAGLGFSGSGIEVALYLSIAVLFYFIFRIRIRQERMEKNLTKIVREITLNNKK